MKLTTIDQVQQRVGKLPAPRDLKVIDHIDEHARRWLSFTSFGFLAFGHAGSIQLTMAGDNNGFITTPDSKHLSIPLSAIDDASIAVPGSSFGALFLIGAMEETLRINGKVVETTHGHAILAVEECYLHCAKAFRRSDFWHPTYITNNEPLDFFQHASFLVIASINNHGQADVSPKGDPEKILKTDNADICFADRPGNRRIDSFRNIIEQPLVSVIALVPGHTEVFAINGRAELRTDDYLMQSFEIQGKAPKLVTRIAPDSTHSKTSPAMRRASLWSVTDAPQDLNPAEIFKDHMKKSRENSLQAKVARAAISLPGAMEKGLAFDYKNNLY